MELRSVVTDDGRQAIHGADVVISGGPILTPPQPVIEADWLTEGVTGITHRLRFVLDRQRDAADEPDRHR